MIQRHIVAILLLCTGLPWAAGDVAASDDRGEVAQVYSAFNGASFWRPSHRIALTQSLAERPAHGLPAIPACVDVKEASDERLTRCLIRHVRALYTGAVEKDVLGEDWQLPGPTGPDIEMLIFALKADALDSYLKAQEPSSRSYQTLKAEMAKARDEAAKPQPQSIPGDTEVLLDGSDPRLILLLRRLLATGDLATSAPSASDLDAAVRRFQQRHGLEVDGRPGRQTIAALNLGPTQRIARLAVALERLRHEPRVLPRERIEANIADATLRYLREDSVALEMRAIVGDPRHPTPVFAANITGVTFNPTWTIPKSIAVNEVLPRLRRNPAYLRDNDIRIIGNTADPYGLNIDWSRVRSNTFGYQLRQDAGAKNPLGAIKFEMANPNDVYLHDTPAKQLFARANRALSHGCVRLQDAAQLAEQLTAALGVQQEAATQASDATRTVTFRKTLPVYIVYRTAFVDFGGTLNFRPDVYRRDQNIAAALGYSLEPLPTGADGGNVACASWPDLG